MVHRNTGDTTPYGYCGLPDTGRYASTPIWGVDLSGCHTRGGRWTGDRLCAYLDDVLVHCLTPYDSTAQPMHLVSASDRWGPAPGARPGRPSWRCRWTGCACGSGHDRPRDTGPAPRTSSDWGMR